MTEKQTSSPVLRQSSENVSYSCKVLRELVPVLQTVGLETIVIFVGWGRNLKQ